MYLEHKLLWGDQVSIRQRNRQFDKDLPAMAQYASQFFGQDAAGLVRICPKDPNPYRISCVELRHYRER
jgi:hypothetical protein